MIIAELTDLDFQKSFQPNGDKRLEEIARSMWDTIHASKRRFNQQPVEPPNFIVAQSLNSSFNQGPSLFIVQQRP